MNGDPFKAPAGRRRDAARDEPWWHHAACQGMDLDLFHPPRGSGGVPWEARVTCWCCPVRQECLDDAMAAEAGMPANHRAGYRGGMTSYQRAHLAEGRAAAPGEGDPLPVDVLKERAHAIRAWALSQGYVVGQFGTLPRAVVAAYNAAHPHEADPETRTPPQGIPVVPAQGAGPIPAQRRPGRHAAQPPAPPGAGGGHPAGPGGTRDPRHDGV